MLATFHYCFDDGVQGSENCADMAYVVTNVDLSRHGIEGGSERWFFIEWHAQEEV
jgi:hypothetical protein